MVTTCPKIVQPIGANSKRFRMALKFGVVDVKIHRVHSQADREQIRFEIVPRKIPKLKI